MSSRLHLHLIASAAFALLLSGCGGSDMVRGQLNYDLRTEDARPEGFWPPPPDPPRYRYLGELVGESNFKKSNKPQTFMGQAIGFIAGLSEKKKTLMLQRPHNGVTSDSGRIYVADAGRGAVFGFDPKPPPDADADDQDGHLLVWSMATPTVRFSSPVAVAIVWNGDIVVSDSVLGAVLRLDNKGQPLGTIGVGQVQRPTGLAFDRERGLLFVADTAANNVKVFDGGGKLVNSFGTPGEGKGEFNAPTYLTFINKHLYVSDTLNSRIQVFDGDGKMVREFGERGLYVGNLARPKGVAVDDAGIVYVVESYFNHLLAYNEHGELLLGINGSGLKDDRFLLPSGAWTDSQGRIYVADLFNGRVVMFQLINTEQP